MTLPIANYWQLLNRYLAPQRRAVVLMALLLLSSIGLQLAGPQVVRRFIDAVQAGASENLLVRAALFFLGVTFAQQMLRVLAGYWSQRVAWTATNALRADLADHLVRLDLSFYLAHTPGELIERVDGDVRELAEFFSNFAVQFVTSALLLLGVLVAVALVDLRLGLAFVIFALLVLLVLSYVRRRGTPHWQADREQNAQIYGYLGEVLTATEDIRTSAATPYVMRRFFAHLQSWLPVRLWAGFWGQSMMTAAILLFAIGDALVYGAGGALYQQGAISLGTVYLLIAYMVMLAAPLEELRTQMQNLQQADAGIARIRELLATRSHLTQGDAVLPNGPLAVTFDHVSFTYSTASPDPQSRNLVISHPTLRNVTFHLPAGRTLGLLGRTGSGKTTLTRLLFRFYDPQEGDVCIGGVPGRTSNLTAWRARIGLVTQEVQLFEATLRDNLTFFDPTVSDDQLRHVLDQLGLDKWLARLPAGLDTPIANSTLSAGEAQLIAFARLFLKDPGLVILDEASSRLDPATEMLLEAALHRLLAGRTAIIIAHRLTTVERVDDILILANGAVQEFGERATLAANPESVYTKLKQTGLEKVIQ
ncbi:MAG: ABC transporter ATP-binding protein [Caldilinea sp. CFX5]|nr:ABC transporter ATP-binding protein [Caldilinea sp. CFX5]